jgi:hypothetical protein
MLFIAVSIAIALVTVDLLDLSARRSERRRS